MMNKATASRAQISLDWTMINASLVRDSASCLGEQGKVSLGAEELRKMLIDDRLIQKAWLK
jgi:hypothetical protein